MNRQFQFVLVLACITAGIVGCNDSNRSKIVGTWGIEQADRVMSRVDTSEDNEGESVQANEDEVDSLEPKMLLIFRSNGTMKTNTNMGSVVQEKVGSWKMHSFDQESNNMKIECILQQQKTEHNVSFVEDDLMELIPPNMAGLKMKLKFRRK